MDDDWTLVSGAGGHTTTSAAALVDETNFNIDLNGDSVIGPLTTKASAGSVDLITGSNGLVFAKDSTGNIQAITWNGEQIGDKTWTDLSVVAAQTINGQNQFIAEHAISGDLQLFSADSNWAVQSNTNLIYNSTDYLAAESNFGVDFNENGLIGS